MPITMNKITEAEFRKWLDTLKSEDRIENNMPYDTIDYYRQIFQRSKNAEIADTEKDFYKWQYIKSIVDYGYRLKGEWDESGRTAQAMFLEALRIDKNLPIVHYRLGHIYFKWEQYPKSIDHFINALQKDENPEIQNYKLDRLQIANAKKLIAYCSIKVFEIYKDDALLSNMYSEVDQAITPYIQDIRERLQDEQVRLYKYEDNHLFDPIGMSYEDYINKIMSIKDDDTSLYIDAYIRDICAGYRFPEEQIGPSLYRLLMNILGIDQTDPVDARNINKYVDRLRDKFTGLGLSSSEFTINKNPAQDPVIQTNKTIYIFQRIEE